MIKNEAARNVIKADFDNRKFGKRTGNLVRMSNKSRYAYDECGFCDTLMIVGNTGACIKRGKKFTRYYNNNGVLVHEE